MTNPSQPQVIEAIAKIRALIAQKSFDQAMAGVISLIEMAPSDPHGHFYEGAIHAAQGRSQKAINAYDRAIALDPTWAIPWFNRGNALMKQRKGFKALKSYRKVVEVDPQFHQAWTNIGDFYAAIEEWDQALGAYDHALAIAPNEPIPQARKMRCLALRSRSNRRIEILGNILGGAWLPRLAAIHPKMAMLARGYLMMLRACAWLQL